MTSSGLLVSLEPPPVVTAVESWCFSLEHAAVTLSGPRTATRATRARRRDIGGCLLGTSRRDRSGLMFGRPNNGVTLAAPSPVGQGDLEKNVR
jgi:hypothetical protein